jgi:excisionase family DNA binding protein
MAEMPTDLRTPKELSRLLRVHPATIRRWIRLKILKGYRVGGRWRASEAAARGLVRESA